MYGLQTSDSDQTLGDSEIVQREHKPETSASGSYGMLLLSEHYNYYSYYIVIQLFSHIIALYSIKNNYI